MDLFTLTGDVGATKTTLAIINTVKKPWAFISKETFPSGDFPTFESLIKVFLKNNKYSLLHASFGIAGPIFEGNVQMPNLPWFIRERDLSNHLNIPVYLLNDLEALANSVLILEKEDLEVLSSGKPVERSSLAVIAPGTGLGEAHLHWVGTNYRSFASEGGHVDFAPTNQIEFELMLYLKEHIGHVSYERVCSGPGLVNLYNFFKDSGKYEEPEWLGKQIATMVNSAPVISQAALENKAEIAVATLNLFTSILGREAGNLALKELATGGVYLGGGIPPRILPFLKKDVFLNSFKDKGRFSALLANIPVYVIRNPDAALIGAAYFPTFM